MLAQAKRCHANLRRHVLPIHANLMVLIQWRLDLIEGLEEPLFSSHGRVAVREETVAALVKDIAAVMAAEGKL